MLIKTKPMEAGGQSSNNWTGMSDADVYGSVSNWQVEI